MLKLNSLLKLGTGALVISLASVFAISGSNYLQAQETDDNTTIEDIEEDAIDAVGEQVTVRGEANEVDPGISFEIAEEGFLEGSEVLVINATGEILPDMPEDELGVEPRYV